MVWLLILLILNLSFCDLSQARHHKNLPSAVIVGTVFCDTCSQEKLSKTSRFISGATVAVECGNGGPKPSFREEVKTDKRGEFKVDLPVSVSRHVKTIEGCSVNLIRSSEAYCAVAAAATSSSFELKSRNQGTHFFSAGFFTFKPLKHPNICTQKPYSNTFHDMKQALPMLDYPALPTPIENPTIVPNVPRIYDNLPPLPFLPRLPPLPQLPPLPPLPPLPGFPIFPPKKTVENAPNGKTLLPHKKHLRPHFVLPPHRLQHPPLFPNIPSLLPFEIPPPPVAAAVGAVAGGSVPSPPSPTSPTPFPIPPVPGLPGIPSPPRQTSP
ncbi:proline-rich protein 4-like [Momordica charantia]|uniref:Proline-rich protein 4-like n=1 Tax=Momordica charantia TaxID=3673 RepID=A0A6J1BYU3_MOMCH|nr:proline-rich protein 4-like [Momordica charantia]